MVQPEKDVEAMMNRGEEDRKQRVAWHVMIGDQT